MRIEKLVLQNYCQFRLLEIDFCPGLNVLVGRIGAGKSNILKAIRLAFTTASGNEGNREEDITYGLDPSGRSGVQLVAQHQDKRFYLSRYIRPSSRKFYWEGSEIKLTSEKSITEEIQTHMGLDVGMFDEFVVVPQGEIANLLDLDDAHRLDVLLGLARLKQYTKRHAWLGAYLTKNQIPAMPEDPAVLELERQKLLVQQEEIRKARNELALPDPEEVRKAEAILESRKLFQTLQQQLQHERTQASTANVMLEKATKAVQEWEGRLPECQRAQEAARIELEAARQQAELANQKALWTSCGARLASLKAHIAQLDQSGQEPQMPANYLPRGAGYEDWVQQEGNNIAVLQQLKGLVDSGRKVCPTCFREVDQVLAAPLEGLEERVKKHLEISESLRVSRQHDDRLEQFRAQQESNKAKREALSASLPAIEQELASYPAGLEVAPEKFVADRHVMRKTVDHQNAVQALQLAERNLAAARLQVATDTANVQHALESIKSLEAQLAQNTLVSEEHYAAAHKLLADRDYLQVQAARLDGSLEVLVKQLPVLLDRIQRAKKAKRLVEATTFFRNSLMTARSLFQRDQLPFELAKSGMLALATKMNEILEAYGAQYRVSVGEGAGFKAHFFNQLNKGVQPDVRLSGGERAQFGLALRVAAHTIWAQDLGFLALDEPTYGFGPADMQHVHTTIEKLRELSSNQGLQVIVVTHENSLLPLFDKVIQIGD